MNCRYAELNVMIDEPRSSSSHVSGLRFPSSKDQSERHDRAGNCADHQEPANKFEFPRHNGPPRLHSDERQLKNQSANSLVAVTYGRGLTAQPKVNRQSVQAEGIGLADVARR